MIFTSYLIQYNKFLRFFAGVLLFFTDHPLGGEGAPVTRSTVYNIVLSDIEREEIIGLHKLDISNR